MGSAQYLLPFALATFLARLFSGRISFPNDYKGKYLIMEDDNQYVIFSDLQVKQSEQSPLDSRAVLKTHFKFDRYPDPINRRLFLMFTPIIAGIPGIHRKIWCFCEKTGAYQGIYGFNSSEHAEKYCRSVVIWILGKRCVPGSLSYELQADTSIEDYLDRHASRKEKHPEIFH